ncbi:MAG: hypothetical protein AB7V42_14900 [Thermoleophilia bacterium]
MTAEPHHEDALAALVDDLEAARAAARAVAGVAPLGVRAVEPLAGRRAYLCAFEGPAFLCLDAALRPEAGERRVREAASASLLWEHLEVLVDAGRLRTLAAAVGRLLALGGDPPQVAAALEVVATRALELATWREHPLRALASVPDLDRATALQERVVGAWGLFVRASDPLVERQDELGADLVGALRHVEETAQAAGVHARLAESLAAAMPDCAEGAAEVAAAHITRLRPG